MNGLSGLDWNAKPGVPATNKTLNQRGPDRSTPSPGFARQSTPGSSQGQGNASMMAAPVGAGGLKSSGADSFANLLSPQPARPSTTSLSLQEKQKQLEAGRQKAQSQQDPFAASDAQFWEGLGSGRGTPAPADQQNRASSADDDLLAAFDSAAPVDAASHFPPPNRHLSPPQPPISRGRSPASTTSESGSRQAASIAFDDDDDPFGLAQMSQKTAAPMARLPPEADDDILGDLGKPVEETVAARQRQQSAQRAPDSQSPAQGRPAGDKALAELVDMGFDVDRARDALSHTSSGDDVQAAIGVLLNEAHKESGSGRSVPQSRGSSANALPAGRQQRPSNGKPDRDIAPPWMRKAQSSNPNPGKSPVREEKELAQVATEISATVWKSANTFWKAGQKRMAKAVAEFQQESDPSHPKWMRDAKLQEEQANDGPLPEQRRAQNARAGREEQSRTSEANLLDGGGPPQRIKANGVQKEALSSRPADRLAPQARFADTDSTQRGAAASQRPPHRAPSRPSERLGRKAVEEETAEAYVSPARRKQTAPKPAPPAEPADTLDIFSDTQALPPKQATTTAIGSQQARLKQGSASVQPRPAAPARSTPQVSSTVLNSSRTHRQAGGAAFKQGDYAAAHESYTKALMGMPPKHPVMIILYSNRALTSIKTGDAKGAISDADSALAIIGPSNGDGESISLGDEGDKPMREFYGKALMRKAEAFEHLEKWTDAVQAWTQAVQAGVGGAVAIQGRNRCEKAASPAPVQKPAGVAPVKKKAAAPSRAAARPSALAQLNGKAEGEAVKRLREQTAAAAAASDEAFALTDQVDARLTAWKSGKAENLRGLLASLDTVLWQEAGWNKVGMADLVLPNRVKIVYMKAIAKVHPDKLSQSATTEQKMISASVFATLNEAWDRFKKDNGM